MSFTIPAQITQINAAGAKAFHAGLGLAEGPTSDVITQQSGSVSSPSGRAANSQGQSSPPRTADGSSSTESTPSARGSAGTDLAASTALTTGQLNGFRNAEGALDFQQ